jgi:hypothetical protein
MPEVTLFCEDSFHEKFIGALIDRFMSEYGVNVTPHFFSSRGGLPRMHSELKEFLRDLSRGRKPMPDHLIVVVDANCKGYNERKTMMADVVGQYPEFQGIVSYAIPDPHIERWMLVDPRAFQKVFGRGCTLPAIKCKKDEYKKLLRNEIHESGVEAPLGGQEFAEDVVSAMDLNLAEGSEPSFGLFLKALKGLFNGWRGDETH